MAKKVGIPRGLFYYQYYPLWKTFFEELGVEIVISDYTTKKILDDGVTNCVDEACLPVKLFHGHVINLKDRVDYLLIPRFTSVSRNEYICPKFGGLPDMVKSTLKDIPPIIDTEVNLRKKKRNALKAALEIGRYFSDNENKIKKAYGKALNEYREYEKRLMTGVLPCDILERKGGRNGSGNTEKITKRDVLWEKGPSFNIAVIGHVYNLYDSYINMNMINKLRDAGANVITIEMIDGQVINEKSNMLPKRMFWNFGRKALGSTLHILERDDIDGIIYTMSFGCGVDSFVCDLIERKVRRSANIPFIVLTIDEHSGEAGMNTRLEAFIDMITIKLSQRLNSTNPRDDKLIFMEE